MSSSHIWIIFPYIGNNHHPNWRTASFFRGVGLPPTRRRLLGWLAQPLSNSCRPVWLTRDVSLSCICIWRPIHIYIYIHIVWYDMYMICIWYVYDIIASELQTLAMLEFGTISKVLYFVWCLDLPLGWLWQTPCLVDGRGIPSSWR